MADLVGQSIGRYHIVEQLGQGGMAVVYKAFDTQLERDVAIKIIRTETFPPNLLDQMLRRFEREARALAKMEHRSIVKIYDYGEYVPDGKEIRIPYLVMEYLPGGTLKDWTNKPHAYLEVAHLLVPIARALDYAHTRGIIHRDVKPANILVTHTGETLLSDFGIAKILETEQNTLLTTTGMGVGTPQYMAPEQWKGQVLPQSDIYSLGVVFYELVTGRRPYDADTPAAILEKILIDPLPRPLSFVPDLPEDVEKVIFKALAKKPEDRYSGMGDFAAALEKLIASGPMQATMQTQPLDALKTLPAMKQPEKTIASRSKDATVIASRRPWPKFARHLIVISVLVLGLLITGGVIFSNLNRTEQPAQASLPADQALIPAATNTKIPMTVSENNPGVVVLPTATATQPEDPSILFNEDFEDGKAQGIRTISGNWQIILDEQGNQTYDVDNSESSEYPGFEMGNSDWKNYVISFRMRILDTGTDGWINVYCRQFENAGYVVSINPYSTILSHTPHGNDWTSITEYFHTNFDRYAWHWIRIELKRTEIEVSIDDISVIRVEDTRYDAGYMTIQAGQFTHAQIDDIKVTIPE